MDLSRSTSMAVNSLPVELLRGIFEFLPPQDLLSACTVSRIFQKEAEQVFYGTIHLSGVHSRVLSWSRLMLESPRHPRMVKALSLTSTSSRHQESSKANLRASLGQALKLLLNLKHLSIQGEIGYGADFIRPWMLLDCPFRLKAFHLKSSGASSQDLFNFFSQQPEIQELIMGWAQDLGILSHLLPSLSVVEISSGVVLADLISRPISHLKILLQLVDMESPTLDHLPMFQETLTHLSIHMQRSRRDVGVNRLVETMTLIASSLPALRFLELLIIGIVAQPAKMPESLSCLKRFKHLEVLLLHPSRWYSFGPWSVHSADRYLCIARDIMENCPSLRRLAFALPGYDNDGLQRFFCYCRSPSSREVVLEGYNIIDQHSWRGS